MAISKPKVLFLCTGNSARSQMAEGLLRSVTSQCYFLADSQAHYDEPGELVEGGQLYLLVSPKLQ